MYGLEKISIYGRERTGENMAHTIFKAFAQSKKLRGSRKCSVPVDSYQTHKAHDIQALIQRDLLSLLQQIIFKIAFIHPRENHRIHFVVLVEYFPFKLDDIGMMEFVQDL